MLSDFAVFSGVFSLDVGVKSCGVFLRGQPPWYLLCDPVQTLHFVQFTPTLCAHRHAPLQGVGGSAPADSEVRNLHLIAVCQPMMWLCTRLESVSTPLTVRASAPQPQTNYENAQFTECVDMSCNQSHETTSRWADRHTSRQSFSSIWCFFFFFFACVPSVGAWGGDSGSRRRENRNVSSGSKLCENRTEADVVSLIFPPFALLVYCVDFGTFALVKAPCFFSLCCLHRTLEGRS